MTLESVRVSPAWLALRERPDADARSVELAGQVRQRLPTGRQLLIHDLGAGTGSMCRWLAPQLPGPQHWVMHDRDSGLLAIAAADLMGRSAASVAVTAATRQRDITRLDPGDLFEADLVTASALLDMLTGEELARWAAACAAAGCPVLVTLSVVGRVELIPADPLDERIAAAFNDHQRRTTDGRAPLGPDAVGIAVDAFTRCGADVLVAPSPWRLGAAEAALAAEWFRGWLGAACEQEPDLTAAAGAYAQRRLAEAAAGRLLVTVHHQDLLALPR